MKKVVTIGGGTGGYAILSGLKHIPGISLTALVSMADSGGSTGVLRDELGVLPAGDVRQCLVALSEHSDIVRKLMNYRFSEGGLSGHNFGNIFLAGLEKVTGDFVQGVEIASEILKVKGRVIPVTGDKATLAVLLNNKKVIEGENAINHADLQARGVKKMMYTSRVTLHKHAKQALLEADLVIIGPGTFHCSIVPSLLVSQMKTVLTKSKAKLVLAVNLTNKQGHTMHWGVKEYVSGVEEYLGRPLDIILVNDEAPSKKTNRFV
jgi:uncharacterized cofD-like protein